MSKRKDFYRNFKELSARESKKNYEITTLYRNSVAVVVAPHAGGIERGTSRIASAIAGEEYSLYLFEGKKKKGNRKLHITSHRFDEPSALNIVESAGYAIGIHGREVKVGSRADNKTIYVGGLDRARRDRLVALLEGAGFPSKACKGRVETLAALDDKFSATNPKNICNRGCSKAGIQLELPPGLRRKLEEDADLLEKFKLAIRGVLD